jgi:hypothetical protein
VLFALAVVAAMLASCNSSPPPDRVVPLGRVDDAQCARMVAELVKHPNWSLQIATQSHDVYLLHPDGSVDWTEKGLGVAPRTLHLTPSELSEVPRFAQLSCVPAKRTEMMRTYALSWGPSKLDGDNVAVETSPLANALDRILDAARARYAESRYAELAPISISGDAIYSMYDEWSPKTAVYRATLSDDGLLALTRGKRKTTRQLDRADLVDLADQLLAPADESWLSDWMRGSITVAGRTLPFTLRMPRELWANVLGVFAQTQREVTEPAP